MPQRRRSLLFLVLAVLTGLLAGCFICILDTFLVRLPNPIFYIGSAPVAPGPILQCTPPACRPGEVYYCPSGNCPGGCGTGCATPTGPATPTLTPSVPTPTGPILQCTPPACRKGEVYYCQAGDGCPGGCGTFCATPTVTPTPLAGPPCAIVATRTPPPSAPTFAAADANSPVRYVDPHVEICADTNTLKVGETATLLAQLVDIGQPWYYVMVRPAGSGEDFRLLATVVYDNEVGPDDKLGPFELVAARANETELTVVVRARTAGRVEVAVWAAGHALYVANSPAQFARGESDPLVFTVEP